MTAVCGIPRTVVEGASLRDLCIVASNAVVTNDVPDRWVVGGLAATRIKEIVQRDYSHGEAPA